MPLFSDDLSSARSAYEALEARAEAAERLAAQLGAPREPIVGGRADEALAALRQRVVDLQGEVITLRGQLESVAAIAADLPLDQFIGAIGLAVAVGEASMPGRTISTFDVEVKAFVAPARGRVGLRFQQPELNGEPRGLSSATLRMARVPPGPGVPSRPSLHDVLTDKQAVFGGAEWAAVRASADVVVEIGRALADVSEWSFPGLVEQSGAIAAVEQRIAAQLERLTLAPERLAAFQTAVEALAQVVSESEARAVPAAADLYRLVEALAATTSAARTVLG